MINKTKIQKLQFWFYLPILFVPLVLNPWGFAPFEIPKISWIMTWVSIGVLILISQLKKQPINFPRPLCNIVFFWLVSLTISTIFSQAPIESFWGTYERMHGLLLWSYYLIHLFLSYQFFKIENYKTTLYLIIVGIGGVVSMIAILQYLNVSFLKLAGDALFVGRTYSTVGQPTMLGQWLIFPFFTNLFLLISKRKNKFIMFSAGIAFILTVLALITTLNRGTFLAIIISCFLCLIPKFQKLHPKFKFSLILGFAAIGIIAIFSGSLRSVFSRGSIWSASLPLILKSPLFGTGLETFYQQFQLVAPKELFETEPLYVIPDRAHNEFIHTFIEQGLFGVTIYLGVGIYLLQSLFKYLTKGNKEAVFLSTTMIASLLSVQVSFMFSAQYIYFFLYFGLFINQESSLKMIQISYSRWKQYVNAIFSLLFFIFSVQQGISSLASDNLFNSVVSRGQNSPEIILDNLPQIIELNPHRAFPIKMGMNLLSYFETKLDKQYQKIWLIDYAQKLKDITNESFEYSTVYGRLLSSSGNINLATNILSQGREKAPNYAYIIQSQAENFIRSGKKQEAKEHFEELFALAPDYISNDQDERTRIFFKTNDLILKAYQDYQEIITQDQKL